MLKDAICDGNLETIKELCARPGFDLDDSDDDGSTGFHFAASLGNTPIMELLINRGANLSLTNKFGATALHFACMSGRIDAVDLMLLKDPTSVNAVDKEFWSPLHVGVSSVSIIKTLLSKGASVFAQNSRGWTALHLAAEKGCTSSIEVLLTEGKAQIDSKDEDGNTPLHLACISKEASISTVEILLKYKANPNLKNNKLETPLHSLRTLIDTGMATDTVLLEEKIKLLEHSITITERLIAAGIPEDRAKEYEALLSKQDVDNTLLSELNNDILKEIGVTSIGHRMKMLKEFSKRHEHIINVQ